MVYTFLISPMRTMRPAQLKLLDLTAVILRSDGYRYWRSSLHDYFQAHQLLVWSTYQSELLCPDTSNLCSSLNTWGQVSRPCETTGKIMICAFK
jgi:hypothetical protein